MAHQRSGSFFARHQIVVVLICALALSFVLFGNGIRGPFILDDSIVVVGNPLIEAQIPNPVEIFTSSYHFHQPRTGLYRPLAIFSYALNYLLFGPSSVSFHVINIILHGFVVFLIFLLMRRMANVRAAIIAAVLFMVFPIHVEDVTSIVGRAEILALGFSLLALLLAMKERHKLAACCFLLALFSKESAVAFLPIYVAWELFIQKRSWRVLLRPMVWYGVVFVIYGILRFIALGTYVLGNDATMVYNPIKFASLSAGFMTACKVTFLYIQKTFVPVSFSSDYSFNAIPVVHGIFSSLTAWAGIIMLVLLSIFAYRKRGTVWGWGILVFLASFFVISNFIFKTGTIMAERLMYAPSLGFAVAMGVLLDRGIAKSHGGKFLMVPLVALVAWYGVATIGHNRDWLSVDNLFTNAYAQEPASVVNQTNKAYLDMIHGDNEAASAMLENVLAIAPDHVPALNLAAQVQKNLGNIGRAEVYWKRTIELWNDYLPGYFGLGVMYYENGYFANASYILQKSVDIYPRWSEVLYLSLALSAQQKYDQAISVIEHTYGKEPVRRDLRFALGVAYYKQGDTEQGKRLLLSAKSSTISESEMIATVEKNSIFKITNF